MAGALRNLQPTMEPVGRTITVRELVGGDPRQSRLVQVRLGSREDRLDFRRGGVSRDARGPTTSAAGARNATASAAACMEAGTQFGSERASASRLNRRVG